MAKRRKANRNHVRFQHSSRSPRVRCTALLVVDQKPFLRKAVTTCRRLRTELHKKQEKLRAFEEDDQAAYSRWVSSTFGKELTRIRELREELSQYEYLWSLVRFCDLYHPDGLPEVVAELLERKEKGTLHAFVPPWEKEGWDAGEDGEDAESEYFEEEDDEDDWDEDDSWESEFFEGEYEQSEERDAEKDRFFGGGGFGDWMRGERPQKNRSEDARIKSLYRSLAKRLHPDHSDLEESMREKRWYELQEAYARDDLEGLHRIEAVCDMDQTGISAKLGLARLRDLIDYHQAHLAPIRRALRFAKREASFGFSLHGATKEVRENMVIHLRETYFLIKERVSHFEELVEDLREDFIEEEEDLSAPKMNPQNGDLWSSQFRRQTTSRKKKEPTHDPRQMNLF